VKRLLYIILFVLCIPFSTTPQSYVNQIKSIEHGVYTDHNFTYPYTQVGVAIQNGLYFELGMLDLPTKIDINFNQTVQQQSGTLSWMINNIEEPVGYRGTPRYKEFYYSVGYVRQFKRYRGIIQYGYSYKDSMIKISNYYRAIDSSPAHLDIGVHLQYGMRRGFLFIGYSWGFHLN